jgi:hypothetical protein
VKESPESVTPLLAPLAALQKLLSHFEDRGTIIGGIAASLLGKPRLTADLDAVFLLSIDEIPELLKAAEREGLTPRIQEVEDFARQHRVVLLRHTESGTNIDISLGMLPFEDELVARSTIFQVGSLSIRLPTPEDLIILKAVAHRPKDLMDIQAVIENYPDLDRDRIEYWVTQFARALESPELWDDISGWLPK